MAWGRVGFGEEKRYMGGGGGGRSGMVASLLL